tara:strand:+ start:11819 stop:11968 length:150 start_codon:yes stop_codon:yes gene_type:complete
MEPKPYHFQIRLAGLALRMVACAALLWIGDALTTQSRDLPASTPLAQID